MELESVQLVIIISMYKFDFVAIQWCVNVFVRLCAGIAGHVKLPTALRYYFNCNWLCIEYGDHRMFVHCVTIQVKYEYDWLAAQCVTWSNKCSG